MWTPPINESAKLTQRSLYLIHYYACTATALYQNLKQIFPEMKLRGLVPIFYIHVSVTYLYIPTIGPQTQYIKIGGPTVGI